MSDEACRAGADLKEFAEAERIWKPVYHSAEAQEGPIVLREKRRPVWTGR